jgi:mono/diheme cytochrome c family protein
MLGACTKKSGSGDSLSAQDLVKRGQTIYVTNCLACHNADPALEGSVGPAIKGSSEELLQARVLRAGYPQGYKPKRQTNLMPALPHLEKEISALHAFLN